MRLSDRGKGGKGNGRGTKTSAVARGLLLAVLSVLMSSGLAEGTQPLPPTWPELRLLPHAQLVEQAPKLESVRHWLALAISQHTKDRSAVSQSLNEAERLIELARDEQLEERQLLAIMRCAMVFVGGAEADLSVCDAMEEIAPQMTDPSLLGFGSYVRASKLEFTGDRNNALVASQEAARYAKEAQDYELCAASRNKSGNLFWRMGFLLQAHQQFFNGRNEAKALPNKQAYRVLSTNLASVELDRGNYQRALNVLEESKNEVGLDPSYFRNLLDSATQASAYLALDKTEMALSLLTVALQDNKGSADKFQIAFATSVLARAAIVSGDDERGLRLFDEAMEVARQATDTFAVSVVAVELAESLQLIGNLEEAEVVLDGVIAGLEVELNNFRLAEALNELALVKSKLGDNKAANRLQKRSRRIRERVYNEQFDVELSSLEARLDLDRKKHQLDIARRSAIESEMRAAQDRLLRNFSVVLSILLGLIAWLVLSRRYQKKLADTKLRQNEKLESEVAQRTQALEQQLAERLLIEQNQQELETSLVESEKLRALGQLTSGVAHDFNNLMTVVSGSAELMQLEQEGPIHGSGGQEPGSQHIENIIAAANSASSITADLLSYARKQSLQPERVNLQEFIEASLAVFRQTLGEGITLTTKLKSYSVLVDEAKLTTSLINLLLNAKEALRGRGSVEMAVDLQYVREGEQERLLTILSVTDDGPGIAAEQLARAVEPFYTTKSAGGGTGLGLSMVDGFAKQSGGDLKIISSEGSGTEVRLFIPLASIATESEKVRLPSESDLSALRARRVLLVEDQDSVRLVLGGLLEQLGMKVDSVASADAALEILQASARPDLLLTDLMMPGRLNGHELTLLAREMYPGLPVLMISGYAEDSGAEGETGVEFLHKPFSLAELRGSIAQAFSAGHRSLSARV